MNPQLENHPPIDRELLAVSAARVASFGSATMADVRVFRHFSASVCERALLAAGMPRASVDSFLYGSQPGSVFAVERGAMSRPMKPQLEALAREHLFIETLEVRGSDSLDFHDVGVAGLASVLEAAFELGRQEGAQR